MIDSDRINISLDFNTGDTRNKTVKQEDLVWFRGIKMTPDVIRGIMEVSKKTITDYQKKYGKDWGKYMSGELVDSSVEVIKPDENRPASETVRKRVRKHTRGYRKYNSEVYEGLTFNGLAKKYGISYAILHGRYMEGDRGKTLVRPSRKNHRPYKTTRTDTGEITKYKSILEIAQALSTSVYRIEKALLYHRIVGNVRITKERK